MICAHDGHVKLSFFDALRRRYSAPNMNLTNIELELAAVGTSIAAGCVPCTRYHMAEASKAGAGDAEILQCLQVGINTARAALDELEQLFVPQLAPAADQSRAVLRGHVAALAAVGAAVARNSVAQLNLAIRAAHAAQLGDDEIMAVIGLATRIKDKAASHLRPVTDSLDADPAMGMAAAGLCS